MATYLILNITFLVAVFGALFMARSFVANRTALAALVILLIFTAIFDSFIVGAGIVAYDWDKLLGITVGAAPIEDFFYALLAAFMIPGLWRLFERRGASS